MEAFPSATASITYSRISKKNSVSVTRRASNKVKYKVYDLALSKSIRYSTTKSKELSKLLTFFGSNGVSTASKSADSEDSDKKLKFSVGVASVMTNFKPEDLPKVLLVDADVTDIVNEEEQTTTCSKKKEKKNKKKGKKK